MAKYKRKYDNRYIANFMNGYIQRANRRGYCFDLSYNEFKSLTQLNCIYCGEPPSKRNVNLHGKDFTYHANGIDRRDSSVGYTSNNSYPCCFTCNRAKGDMPHDDFIIWLKKVSEVYYGDFK